MRPLYPLLALLLISPLALADQEPPTYNRVSLQSEARAEVDNDIIVAVLYIQKEGNNSDTLAEAVNDTMQWAVNQAGRVRSVEAQTLGYRTTPVYRKDRASSWRVSQSLRLESRDHRALSRLIGQLQNRLAVQSVGYQISDARRREAEEKLITEALQRFQSRARLVAGQLGRKTYRLVNVDVSTGGAMPPPVARTRMLSADMVETSPRLVAGTSEVVVQVRGSVELSEN